MFSLLLPIPLLLPPLLGASPTQIQAGFVIYLLTPALLVGFQAGAWMLIETLTTSTSEERDSNEEQDSKTSSTRRIAASYSIVGAASAFMHIGILVFSLVSNNSSVTITSLYYPASTTARIEGVDILTRGALIFFQWDFIIIILTVVTNYVFISGCLTDDGPVTAVVVTSTLIVIGFVTGPGALLAYSMIALEYENILESI
jgi:hypothetical protein